MRAYLLALVLLSLLLSILLLAHGAYGGLDKSGVKAVEISRDESDSALNYIYEDIDAHAIQAPKDAEASLDSLAAYLTGPCKDDREKAWVIYRWTTDRITYDVQGYSTGSYGNLAPEEVLKERSSVCEGYVGLFQALAERSGLTSTEIRGYAKGSNYVAGFSLSEVNHAWNAVSINGSWYLIDPSWGSGRLEADGRFNKSFDPHYFMTPPEELIYDHLPEEAQWQLLDKPISKREFEERVYVKPEYFKYGIKAISHQNAVIDAEGPICVALYVPDGIILSARLTKLGDGNAISSDSSASSPSAIFDQREDDLYKAYALPPSPGAYLLKIFAKPGGSPGDYQWAMEYRLNLSKGSEGKSYPMTYGVFSKRSVRLYAPMEGCLRPGVVQRFKLSVPGAESVACVNGGQWTYLTEKDGLFGGEVTPIEGDITVCAKFQGMEDYSGLLKYAVKK